MSRISLHRPRRNRAVWDRPANGTRLLQSSSSYTVSPRYPLPGDGRSIDSTRHTLFYGHSRDCAHTLRRTTPAHSTGEADRPYYTGLLPGAIAPPAHSPVAYLGVLPLPSDGSEDALPPPLRLAERMVGFNPLSGLPRRSLRRESCRTATAESPRPHISEWPGTSGGRDCPTPRFPRVSSTSSQKHEAVAKPAPMWNIRFGGMVRDIQYGWIDHDTCEATLN